jgi:putative hydrolase of HD superfamily
MGKKDRTLLNFISEAGALKRVRRSGWWVVGIKDAETVADHSFRCAVIGYVLASMEGASAYKVLLMTLFNDIHEARLSDLHKMSQRYVDIQKAEDTAFKEQMDPLPEKIKNELGGNRREYRGQKTRESLIARDADILECLIQAKEYHEHGHKEAVKFMKKAPSKLVTRSAKALWKSARSMKLSEWWESLSEFRR